VVKFLTLLAGVSLLLAAFLRPRWGFHWEEIKRKGVDLMVAVDVSESMLAEDIQPNRLERAKREITDLVSMLRGDRIGLIAFAGAAFMECPLTLDYGAFKIFLDYLDTELIPVQGTAIGEAIRTALTSFPADRRASRALILITDGEDHPGEAVKAAQAAKEQGVKIFTIGIGSKEGAPIPLRGDKGGFKQDRKGQVVMSKLKETTLQKIALTTGGSYVRSVSGDMDLKKIYEEEIRGKMEAGELKSTKKRRWEERFQWFLFGSILLFFLEAILPERKRLPTRGGVRTGRLAFWRQASLVFLFASGLLFSATLPARAESVYTKMKKAEKSYENEAYDEALREFLDAQVERPEDTLLKYNIGTTQYRMRSFGEAEEAFWGVATSGDPERKQRALYNLGNCAYRQGKLDEAVEHYKQALDLDPEDEDARHNLEFVREEIKRRLNEAREREEEQQEKQQQGQTCQDPQPQKSPSQGADGTQENAPDGQQKLARQEPEQEQGPSPQPGQEPETQDASGKGQQAGAARRMSPEEAERWLNTLDEDQKEMARRQAQKALGRRSFLPEKDW
jgi:Ca-activated chloride channel family protein